MTSSGGPNAVPEGRPDSTGAADRVDELETEKESSPPKTPGDADVSGGLVKDAKLTFASRVLAIVISIGIASATAWLLGPGGRGEVAICMIFAQLLVLGLGFGVEMGSAYHAGRDREQIGAVLGTQLVSFAVTSVMIIGVGVACMWSPLAFVQKVPTSALVCAIGFAVTQVFFVFLTVLFMGLGRLKAYNLARIGNQTVTLLFILVACGITRSVTLAVVAYAFGSLLAGAGLVLALAQERLVSRITFSWRTTYACYRYGIKYYFGKLATLVDVQMGVIVIAMAGTTEQAGLFAAAMGLASRLWILPETLNIVLLPRVLTEQSALIDLVIRCCRVAVIVVAVAALLLAVLAKPIVAILLSPAFLPAVVPLLILLPGVVLGCVAKVLISYFNGTGRPELTSITLFVGVAFNVTMVIVLLPRWGLLGVAVATSAAYVIEATLAVVLFRRLTKCSWRAFLPQAADYQTIRSLLRRGARTQADADRVGETSR